MADKKPRVARDPAPLAGVLIAALWAYIAAEVLWAYVNLTELRALAPYGPDAALDLFNEAPKAGYQDLIIGLGSLIAFVAFVVTGFLTLKWIYRANLNAIVLAPDKSISPPWAVGWHFVPFAALYMPFKAMRETWQISHAADGWRKVPVPGLLRWWWGLFLVTGFLDNIATRMAFVADTTGVLAISDQFSIVSAGLSIPTALLLMTIVRRITAAQVAALGARSATG